MEPKIKPMKTQYRSHEQLYALCVLLRWIDGIAVDHNACPSTSVILLSRPKGNTGLSAYLLETNPNVTDIEFMDVPSLPNSPIFFKVLGITLEVIFDKDGKGFVTFPEMPYPEHI